MKYNTLFNVAGYIRLSRDDGDKEESDSVGNQRRLLTEYIEKREEFILLDVYVDDGYSGTNFRRPAFLRMVDDIEGGKINCVVVKDLSRFGRDYIEAGKYLERTFPELGVRFISILDGIDSLKQSYDMLLPIKNIFNEQYARDISNKIQTVVKTKQKLGEFIGAFASYGYKKSPMDKNKLIIDDYAASVVRRIFGLYIKGTGKQRIARILNQEGILCPSEYKRVNGEKYKNSYRLESTSYWTYSTIHKLLENEIYIGNMVQGKKHQRMRSKQQQVRKEDWIIVKNTHESIIGKDTWEKAQILLKKRTRNLDYGRNRTIFAGFIICADCGRSLVKNQWSHSDGSRIYSYCCGTYKRNGKDYCTPHNIRHDILENIVLNDLKMIVKNIENLKKLVKMERFSVIKNKKIIENEIAIVKAELDKVKRLKKTVYEDYSEGLLSKEEFLSYRQDYTKREELYTCQLQVLEEKYQDDVEEDIFETPWLKQLLELREIKKLDRETIVEMISMITIYEGHKIKLTYNFTDEMEHLFPVMFYDSKETVLSP